RYLAKPPLMKKYVPLMPMVFAILFPLLLNNQRAGLNVLLLNTAILSLLWWGGRLTFRNSLVTLTVAGTIVSSVMCLLNGSVPAVSVYVISLILLSGLLAAPYLSVLLNGFLTTFISLFTAPFNYLKNTGSVYGGGAKTRRVGRYLGYIIIPVFVLLIFVSLYSAASPYFKDLTGDFMLYVERFFNSLFRNISPQAFAIGVGGFITGVILLFGKMTGIFDLPGETGVMDLQRIKKWYKGSMIGLRAEARIATLLFVLLNAALAVMNVLDFWHVWINFRWDGGFLKQFVHEGTWLLILSIVISMALVLWYFRGNLNFYRRNKGLKILARVWLAQNIFLAFSVAVRNFWYLHYFNLAYKRIWVFAFLIMVIAGLITVIIKVEQRKTLKYLLVRNSVYVYIIFVIMGMFNWDVIIAKFNVSRADKAFYHTDFMVTLNESALPYLMMDKQRYQVVEKAQAGMFTYSKNYLSFADYDTIVMHRKELFINEFQKRHWLSWNAADWRSYRKLLHLMP
ncbi:MAG TPA: DUF4173 domain-containing protein, partial [Lentimicrobium sp.]|nr:DUF4173 domain-containing protein [Lentimicrobium sp.]